MASNLIACLIMMFLLYLTAGYYGTPELIRHPTINEKFLIYYSALQFLHRRAFSQADGGQNGDVMTRQHPLVRWPACRDVGA
jgi:hypothetical protein